MSSAKNPEQQFQGFSLRIVGEYVKQLCKQILVAHQSLASARPQNGSTGLTPMNSLSPSSFVIAAVTVALVALYALMNVRTRGIS